MKEDFSELVQYLDGKFTRIDERFENINQKLGVRNINYSGLKQDFKNLQILIAIYSWRADVFLQEIRALSHK